MFYFLVIQTLFVLKEELERAANMQDKETKRQAEDQKLYQLFVEITGWSQTFGSACSQIKNLPWRRRGRDDGEKGRANQAGRDYPK